MSEKKANNTIKKPYESQNGVTDNTYCYTEMIEKVMLAQQNAGYAAKYVVGVTFGVNLTKWRDILKTIFCRENNEIVYNDVKKFENAVLLTDPIYVEDNDEISKNFLSDNLDIRQPRRDNKSYLHTKFILVYMQNIENENKNKYILFVSSKNISNSNNFDIMVPLFSKEKDNKAGNEAGNKVKKYLEFLMPHNNDNNWNECLKGLENIDFDVENNDGEFNAKIVDFEITYGSNKRFSDEIWGKIENAGIIISPYISECEWNEIKDKDKKILSYVQTWNKLFEKEENSQNRYNCQLFVGAECGRRYKFHSKIYVTKEEGNKNTKLYFGSANLTKEAKECHCEMLVGIEFDDEGGIYDYINMNIVATKAKNIVEEYKQDIKVEDYDQDDEIENNNNKSRTYKYALYKKVNDSEYEIRVFNNNDKIDERKERKITKKEIFRFIDGVYICKDNYYEPDIQEESDTCYVSYDDFKKIVECNVGKLKTKYYENIFLHGNVVRKRKKKNASRANNNSESVRKPIKYPCLYRIIQNEEINDDVDVKKRLEEILNVQMDGSDDAEEIVKIMKGYIKRNDER